MAIPVLSIKESKMMSMHMSRQPTASWNVTEMQLAGTSCHGGARSPGRGTSLTFRGGLKKASWGKGYAAISARGKRAGGGGEPEQKKQQIKRCEGGSSGRMLKTSVRLPGQQGEGGWG